MKVSMEEELTYETMPAWNDTLQEFIINEKGLNLQYLGCLNLKECFTWLIDHLLPKLEAEIQTYKTKYFIKELKASRTKLHTIFDDLPAIDQTQKMVDDILRFVKNEFVYSTYCSQPPTVNNGNYPFVLK